MKQHFLPECYLKEFINENKKINTIDLNRIKYGKEVFDEPKFPSEVCKVKDLYTIKSDIKVINKKLLELSDLELEQQFYTYENNYAKIINQIKVKQNNLSASDAYLLIYALIEIKVRNPFFRKKAIDEKKESLLNEILDNAKKQIGDANIGNISNSEIHEIISQKKAEILTNQNFNQSAHISALIQKGQNLPTISKTIAKKLLGFEWQILESENLFITTDNPGFSIGMDDRVQNTRFDKNFIFMMPLTPSLCLLICDAVNDNEYLQNENEKKLNYVKILREDAHYVNQASLVYFTRYIFSNSKSVIDEIAMKINNKTGT